MFDADFFSSRTALTLAKVRIKVTSGECVAFVAVVEEVVVRLLLGLVHVRRVIQRSTENLTCGR